MDEIFNLVKIKNSKDIFGSSKCKVTFGLSILSYFKRQAWLTAYILVRDHLHHFLYIRICTAIVLQLSVAINAKLSSAGSIIESFKRVICC